MSTRQPAGHARQPKGPKRHLRLLREALAGWMAGQTQPACMPSWVSFVAGVSCARHVSEKHRGDVLLVSSGGPISTAVAQVPGAPPSAMLELNMRNRNSSLIEFA